MRGRNAVRKQGIAETRNAAAPACVSLCTRLVCPFKTLAALCGPAGVTCRALQTGGWKMKHTWNAFRMILVCWVVLGALANSAQAAPGDQPNPTDKFKNLEFREIGPATMGGRIDD